MPLKVSISLPGDATITLEASEPEVYSSVVGTLLKELPRDLMRMQIAGGSSDQSGERDRNVPDPIPVTPVTPVTELADVQDTVPVATAPTQPERKTDAEESFSRFCGELTPTGDMRRVVVAAEGARRFLEMESVSDAELGHLFDLAGWRRPGQFLQTLRNAARSKFRWLERVPSETGYYAVTPRGRETVLSSDSG